MPSFRKEKRKQVVSHIHTSTYVRIYVPSVVAVGVHRRRVSSFEAALSFLISECPRDGNTREGIMDEWREFEGSQAGWACPCDLKFQRKREFARHRCRFKTGENTISRRPPSSSTAEPEVDRATQTRGIEGSSSKRGSSSTSTGHQATLAGGASSSPPRRKNTLSCAKTQRYVYPRRFRIFLFRTRIKCAHWCTKCAA